MQIIETLNYPKRKLKMQGRRYREMFNGRPTNTNEGKLILKGTTWTAINTHKIRKLKHHCL